MKIKILDLIRNKNDKELDIVSKKSVKIKELRVRGMKRVKPYIRLVNYYETDKNGCCSSF